MKGKDSVMAARRRGIPSRLAVGVMNSTFRVLNRVVPWHQWPIEALKGANLLSLRSMLRDENLHDTSARRLQDTPRIEGRDLEHLYAREWDGSFNDLGDPSMGRSGERFGRNAPLHLTYPPADLLTPNPREISQRLLARREFVPATTLNLLAAAWIQYQVHDWFGHDVDEQSEIVVPPPGGASFQGGAAGAGGEAMGPMRVARTREDLPRLKEGPPAYANRNSHWWDGSQIYGDDEATTALLRSDPDGNILPDGRLTLDKEELLRRIPDPRRPGHLLPLTGFTDNWWIGLELLHTLFTREHNSICEALRLENRHWTGEQIFQTARLVNAALMAKIHTIEWTPAILGTKTLERAMNTNWSGLPSRSLADRLTRFLVRILGDDELLEGILRTSAEHHTAPYALTEEFVAVYRMHPLIPDDYAFRALGNGKAIPPMKLMDLAFEESRAPLKAGATMSDIWYSFALSHPGAITLRNYPRALLDIQIPGGRRLDVGAVDILRDRERGVPRYNRFREMLRMPRVRTFEAMAQGNADLARDLRDIYGDVEKVDTMVGLFSEKPPEGFGFSDTAFRIFILMASRRLKSDRFFTDDYRPEIYTPFGIDWVETNTLGTVLARHYPDLKGVVRMQNAFRPWTPKNGG